MTNGRLLAKGGAHPRETECNGRCRFPQFVAGYGDLRPGEASWRGTGRALAAGGGGETRLAPTNLEAIADSLIDQSIAPSTKRTYSYSVGQRQYQRLCGDLGVPPLPASEQVLILFMADL